MRLTPAHLLAPALLAGLTTAWSTGASTLEPYQMVRSLQLVQDDLAAGDHAALPMQRKLLEMIDERLRTAPKEEFADIRNLRAVLVYGVSGGNPRTVEIVLARLGVTKDNPVAAGVLGYLQGRTEEAITALDAVDPMKEEYELGAFLALVKGTVLAGQDPAAGIQFLDQARLLAPGTLVEESALRRTVSLAAALGNAERFLRASSQYVRRFLRSPYASQFADAFVAGAVSLYPGLSTETMSEVIGGMTPDHQQVIYLRLARRGMLDGLMELSAFAAERAAESADRQASDPRADLYSSIASVTSANVGEVAAKLKAIDPTQLSEGDRKLLTAAKAVAAEVLAAPNSGLVEISAEPKTEAVAAAAATGEPEPEPQPEPVQVIVEDARRRLAEIDKLLGEAMQ
jgi:chemotaxis protein MotC